MEMHITSREKLENLTSITPPRKVIDVFFFMQNGMLKIKRSKDGC